MNNRDHQQLQQQQQRQHGNGNNSNNNGNGNFVATPTDPNALKVSVPITLDTPFALLVASAGADYPAVGGTSPGTTQNTGNTNGDTRGAK